MAKTYGQRPCDYAFEGQQLSVFERQMFDLFVATIAVQEEQRQLEKIKKR